MTDIIKSSKATGVTLVRDGEGKYRVLVGAECRVETTVLTLAEIEYDEAVDELMAPARARAAKERGHFDARAMSREASNSKHAKATKKGGKGR